MGQVASSTAIQIPFLDPNGRISFTWQKVLQQWQQQLASAFDSNGNLKSNIEPTVAIMGRDGTIGLILQNINENGVVDSQGIVPATSATQGGVILPIGATSNLLGSAAIASSTSFDAAGSANTAQNNAEMFATAQANTAQSNAQIFATEAANSAQAAAEAFASDASNLSSGTVPNARLGGISVTITTASLTPGGSHGSMTFTNGLLTAQVQAT